MFRCLGWSYPKKSNTTHIHESIRKGAAQPPDLGVLFAFASIFQMKEALTTHLGSRILSAALAGDYTLHIYPLCLGDCLTDSLKETARTRRLLKTPLGTPTI